MCIGLPMRVLAVEPGFAQCAGREERRVSTALVGTCAPGDWLLVFLDSARARLDATRAAEIDATLDLLQAALSSVPDAPPDASFALPSSMSGEQLAALLGQ